MALQSAMVPLGTPAPDFTLPDLAGQGRSLTDFEAPVLLVAFLCNHCPYVKHIETAFGQFVSGQEDLNVVGICSNDAVKYPDDGPEGLADQAKRAGWEFPYLIDESQDVARAYSAVCTPDFFLYGPDRKLAYRGAFDGSSPGNGKPLTGEYLAAAVEAVRSGQAVPEPHHASVGCGIKWK
ncbi:thioredoxin family protein [Natronoglycomyces albus]|uniref:Thioredoxin family protein n=1 Tax=Natronoglycomyces albus TaxID=2811108 RepID=A0A895XQY7_9ACTN|nr:thioredoxin family protein [Natronoglycomyces albus]QSB05933.1 thioredoxin family protein [Natronoglycomyces albus]